MPTYNCECCQFTTLLKSNHTNHLLTKKHIRNSQIVSPKLAQISFPLAQISPVYPCKYCEHPFKFKQSMYRDIKYSCTKNKTEDLAELVRLMNIYLSNLKDKYLMVYEDGEVALKKQERNQ